MDNSKHTKKFIKSLQNEGRVSLNAAECILKEILNFFGKLCEKPSQESWKLTGLEQVAITVECGEIGGIYLK